MAHAAPGGYTVRFRTNDTLGIAPLLRVVNPSARGSIGGHVGRAAIGNTTDNPYVRKFDSDETSTPISGEFSFGPVVWGDPAAR